MAIVTYGAWEISVDIEKTREYYKSIKATKGQANRNFMKYCETLSKEERAFFDAFGVTPECCEIEHIGVNRRKEFPCGGYYLICGEYLKYPEELWVPIEEFAKANFEDERDDPRIRIGLFEFAFQCQAHIVHNIPDDMPNGFICLRFWCEQMRWLLEEKPEEGMRMYEPPRIWEIGRMLRERREAKQAQARYLEECKKTYKTLFEQLGISYREMGKAEISAYKKQWIATFAPSCADKRKIKELCLSSRRYTPFLWHLFSYEFLSSVEEASSDFDRSDKSSCVFISNLDEIGFVLKGAERLTAEIIENESNGFIDVTISDEALTWTYCKTHEEMCGPYYYAR